MLYDRKYSNQSGAALIEFALVLPILLAFSISVIYYGYVFMLDAAVTHAAKQGTQVAININPVDFPSTGAFQAEVVDRVTTSVTNSLLWLPTSVRATLVTPPNIVFSAPDGGQPGTLLVVTVTINVSGGSSALLPQVDLPGIGPIPPLPGNLNGVAQVVL